MPWEVTIKKANDEALGSQQEVIDRIKAAIPTIQWWVEPPMMEKIKDMPDHPFHKLIPTWSAETQAYMSKPHLRGALENGELYIEFQGFEQDPVRFINLEVRGNGNPMPPLAAICLPSGWMVIDLENNEVDLAAGDAASWESFRQYRDHAIGKAMEKDAERGQAPG